MLFIHVSTVSIDRHMGASDRLKHDGGSQGCRGQCHELVVQQIAKGRHYSGNRTPLKTLTRTLRYVFTPNHSLLYQLGVYE